MEQFEKLCNSEDLELLSNDKPITISNRFKLDSFTFNTLLSQLGEAFTSSELDEIYLLERKNILRLINASYMTLFDSTKFNSNPYLSQIKTRIAHEVSDTNVRESVFFTCAINYLLSNGDSKAIVKFEGTIPKKLFSFRQTTAETWFKDYVNLVTQMAGRILKKMDKEQAFAFILSNTAYYLNKSQTFKYYQRPGESMNSALSRITSELVGHSSSSMFGSISNVPLYKDI